MDGTTTRQYRHHHEVEEDVVLGDCHRVERGNRLRGRLDADGFAGAFYETLFEIAPETRSLFPSDLTAQRRKLVDELVFLIDAAGDLVRFVERARDLGRRHAGYGVSDADYEAVGAALVTTVADHFGGDWTPAHQRAWTKLFRLIADVMREGANSALFA